MKRKKVATTLALALTINTLSCVISVPKAQAQENTNISVETQNNEPLSLDQISKFDQFIFYNENTRLYEIDNIAKSKLDSIEYQKLENSINNANECLSTIDFNTGDLVEVVDANNSYFYKNNELIKDSTYYNQSFASARSFKEGVNKVVTYWWGLDVYIKKSTLRAAGDGATIAGIWIPYRIIGAVASTCGVAISKAPGGIAFRYNYAKGCISSLAGLPGGSIQGITKVWWQ